MIFVAIMYLNLIKQHKGKKFLWPSNFSIKILKIIKLITKLRFLFGGFFYLLSNTRLANKHQGRTRLGELIRPVWL